ncbi:MULTISPECIES: polyprenyl synthetase family protein [Laceyella]|uniref:Geranylgeranyl diphosphate synthase type II n=1 Tax=Laceyella sediminis TaxID=573074 RepID=A0ABX5ENW1_9BACL|nr:farnesyl diphosphate synthase [Laceyella sediminis]PRZ13038.1 geranylgeranyl diphosphate synthase type II [Laceyella sediminis]
MQIQSYMREKAKLVHQALDDYTAGLEGIPSVLKDAMRYSLLAGGKRFRPVLVLATVEALGGNTQQALPFACAIEMIHTYSLIHDDLPAMDDDDVRRGMPTNHKVYGEAHAILAGDALLTEAFGIMARAAGETGVAPEVALALINEASVAAGAKGMVGGQVDDLLGEGRSVTLAELESIHHRKTGDLIAFSVRAGAMVAGADEEALTALTRYAYRLGLAFQIQDDILDVIGDAVLIGKPVGSDEANQKATYPALLGLEESKKRLNEITEQAKNAIIGYAGINPERLLQIADYLLARDR